MLRLDDNDDLEPTVRLTAISIPPEAFPERPTPIMTVPCAPVAVTRRSAAIEPAMCEEEARRLVFAVWGVVGLLVAVLGLLVHESLSQREHAWSPTVVSSP
jgi:hypothetical protein